MSTGADAGAVMLERFALKALVESCLIVEEGVAGIKDVDLAMLVGGGISPPPLAGADQAGLDVVLERLERAVVQWGEDFTPPTLLRRLVAQGRLGVRTGQGFFPYPRPDRGWESRPVKLETRAPVAIAWLDRPPANSLSPEMIATLRTVVDEAIAADQIRSLVFTSANPMLFCAGADIKAFQKLSAEGAADLAADAHDLFATMAHADLVTIAAVNAAALGGGCELAMACDLRIAADGASFGQPEIGLGIIPGFGGTQRLPRLIGTGRALEMNLIGEPIGAVQAYEHGLVNRLVPDHELLDTALAWALRLAAQAPLPVGQIKRVSAAGDLDAGIAAEQAAFGEVFASADAREGIAAFVEKRPARWRGA